MDKYSKVTLKTNNYFQEGAKQGDVGYVIEIYPDGNCEVEFSNPESGITYALIVAKPEELMVLE